MTTASASLVGQAGRFIGRNILLLALLFVLIILVVYPIGILIYASFVDQPPRAGSFTTALTLKNYFTLWNADISEPALNSIFFAVFGSGLAILIGSMLAWLVARTDAPNKGLIGLAGVMPLFMSSLVGALAYGLLASPRAGYLNIALRDIGAPFILNVYSSTGIVLVLGLFYAPYAFLFMLSALQLMNPELEEAAETHGASRAGVVTRITFPLVKPALLGSAVLTFVLTLENFPVLQVLGSPAGIDTMPSTIFRLMMQTPPRPNEAAAAGMMLLVMMVLLVYIQSRVLRGRSYVTISGKGFRPKLIPLGVLRWPAFGLAMIYVFLAVVLPVFALLQSALRNQPYIANFAALFDPAAFSMRNFSELLSYQPFLDGLKNSIIVGAFTALVGTAFHFLVSYYVNRTTLPLRRAVEYVAMLPVAVPSLLIGMGFLWAWLRLPVPIYGTLTILVLAYVARFLPQGYRSISSTILQVHRDLEDSAVVAGASRWGAVWKILVPLILPGIASTMLLLLILSMRELSTSIFLFTTDTRVLAVVVYEQWEAGRWPRVATISLIYSALLSIITVVGWRWLGLKSL